MWALQQHDVLPLRKLSVVGVGVELQELPGLLFVLEAIGFLQDCALPLQILPFANFQQTHLKQTSPQSQSLNPTFSQTLDPRPQTKKDKSSRLNERPTTKIWSSDKSGLGAEISIGFRGLGV